MDIGRSFRFVFDDPRWFTKLLIGGLLAVVPIVNFFGIFAVIGYALRLTRRVMDGYDTPLPEWDDLGGLALLGLKWMVVQFIWFLPLMVVSIVLPVGGAMDDGGLVGLSILAIVALTIGWVVVIPAVSAHFAATESIQSALEWRTILSLVKVNVGDYLVLVPLGMVLALIGQAGWAVFGLGVLLTAPWSTLALAHLWGQVYFRSRAVLAMMAQPAAPPATVPAVVPPTAPAAPVRQEPLPPLEP